MMKVVMIAALAASVCTVPSVSFAQRNEDTVGRCISDGFLGNEPNIAGSTSGPSQQPPGERDGRVSPSQSPDLS
jgi:hypothetical protein